jgi:hypothetical protein
LVLEQAKVYLNLNSKSEFRPKKLGCGEFGHLPKSKSRAATFRWVVLSNYMVLPILTEPNFEQSLRKEGTDYPA